MDTDVRLCENDEEGGQMSERPSSTDRDEREKTGCLAEVSTNKDMWLN